MNVGDFDSFMRQVHGYPPFPWQSQVVTEAVERGAWPALVDAPTGLGKTSMLDIAVFLLAMSAGGEAPAGLGRRRIYMVVDRRIVVDQAEQHGRLIADALDEAERGTICWEIAERLRGLSSAREGDPALRVVKMRGGTTWDAAWLSRPDLPAIVTGTVDQVGSRLFFRGYGVSARRRPIDAALVGTDSVIMIDEAHLAQAFTAALASASELDSSEVLGLPSTSIVHLSATAVEQSDGWSAQFDEEAHRLNVTADRRLRAAKTLSFVDSSEKTIVKEVAGRAAELASRPGARVLVVCNTVNRAREVHDALISRKKPSCVAETMLLMGRSRPLDRERIAERVTELFGAEREQTPVSVILVATQTIEVGIDLDATDMVTETAAWDALVQRFGRVNRRGDFSDATVTVVEDNAEKPPVYGQAKSRTAAFLRAAACDGLDVSPLALRHVDVPSGLTAEPPLLPVLLPAQLDAWARTGPAPSNDPPLDPYLHGIKKATAQVTVAWRDGLVDAMGELLSAREAGAAVDALPVRSEECAELSLRAVRDWLLNKKPSVMADVDEFGDIPFSEGESDARVLRRAADADWQWVAAAALRPGDAIVVPSRYGGLDRFGWNPVDHESVRDVAELASLRRGRAVLRLDPGLGDRLGLESPPVLAESRAAWLNAEDPAEREEVAQHLVETVREWLSGEIVPADGSPWTAEDLTDLRKALSQGAVVSDGDDASTPPALLLHTSSPRKAWQGVDEGTPADSSSLNRRVSLADHLKAVAARSGQIADNLGLPQELSRVIVDAARWHDLGKVDRRFQAMLFGGSEIAAELAEEPLAKSGMPQDDRAQRLRALRLSGLPRGARHEAWSETIVAAHLQSLEEPYPGDEDLLRHLVASHHGHDRPLLPPVDDPGTHTVDADVEDVHVHVSLPTGVRLADADRFVELNARYGRWGLALLETIVRCADMTVSSEGS